MAIFKWNESLSVNINSIDDQHKLLFDMINDFYDDLGKVSPKELISDLIVKMKNYTESHFGHEEKYFIQYNYPDYESHIKEHREFIAKISEIEKKIISGKMVMTMEVTGFLRDWLKNHIQVCDQKYSDFLISRGVK